MADDYAIGGKPLKDCSDAVLFAVWDGLCGEADPTIASGGLRCSIESEMVLRRAYRAASQYQYPPDRFPV